jgi:hypothetical protein
MNQIYQQPQDLPLKEGEIKALFKYFNLCGEEYLYFARDSFFQRFGSRGQMG